MNQGRRLKWSVIMRVNEAGRFGSTRPAFGFGIEKASISRRHAFSLVFSNGAGTTISQRSATRASLLGSFAEESLMSLGDALKQ